MTGVRTVLHIFPPPEFPAAAASWIAGRITSLVDEQGRCGVALAGGETPRLVYRRLADLAVPWESVELYFGDERRVPPDDPQSNFRMLRETLLEGIRGAGPIVHRLEGEWEDGESAALAYERLLPVRLDLVLLGMGADSHTASLFPGSPAVGVKNRRVIPVPGPAGSVPRITLTAPEIERAREICVLVAGRAKAKAVARALHWPVDISMRPIQLARRGTWILDTEAASELPLAG
jgi:6-phosphogluconolactonase